MKSSFALVIALVLIQAGVSFAADNTCEKNFGLDVAYCAQTLNDTQFSSPKEKGQWAKACVDQAKINKMVCESGVPSPDACLQQCQITYDADALSCQQTFDPNTHCAFGDLFCISDFQAQLTQCLSNAVDGLNACNAACYAQ
jgi:hypothetical protein